MNTIIAFLLGGIICGIVAFMMAACLFRAPIMDEQGEKYTEGYRDGWGHARNYYSMEKRCEDCAYIERGFNELPCYLCGDKQYWTEKKDCDTCSYSVFPRNVFPCCNCYGLSLWREKDDSRRTRIHEAVGRENG